MAIGVIAQWVSDFTLDWPLPWLSVLHEHLSLTSTTYLLLFWVLMSIFRHVSSYRVDNGVGTHDCNSFRMHENRQASCFVTGFSEP